MSWQNINFFKDLKNPCLATWKIFDKPLTSKLCSQPFHSNSFLLQQLHCNSTNYDTTKHMTRNIHCMTSKILFGETYQKLHERLKWWWTPYAAEARAAPPLPSPWRSAALQLPHPSPEPPPVPAAPSGRTTSAARNKRKPTHPLSKYLDLTNLPLQMAGKISAPAT